MDRGESVGQIGKGVATVRGEETDDRDETHGQLEDPDTIVPRMDRGPQEGGRDDSEKQRIGGDAAHHRAAATRSSSTTRSARRARSAARSKAFTSSASWPGIASGRPVWIASNRRGRNSER